MTRRITRRRPTEEQAADLTIPPDAEPYLRWADNELLTCRQAAILSVVMANPGVSVGAIAAVVNVPKPSVTRALDKLAEWSLAYRSHAPGDRRLIAVYPGKRAKTPPPRGRDSTRGGG